MHWNTSYILVYLKNAEFFVEHRSSITSLKHVIHTCLFEECWIFRWAQIFNYLLKTITVLFISKGISPKFGKIYITGSSPVTNISANISHFLSSSVIALVLAVNTRSIFHTTQGFQLHRSSEHDQNTQQQIPNLYVSCNGIHKHVIRFVVVHPSPRMALCSYTGRHLHMLAAFLLRFLRLASKWSLCRPVLQIRCSSEWKIRLGQL